MPVVTAIDIQKKQRQRVNLFIDHQFYCGVTLEAVMKLGLKKGQELTEDELNQLAFEDQAITIRESALHLLDVRPRSRAELQRRLTLKGYAQEDLRPVLDQLEKSGLLNDTAFAKMLVRHLRSKHMGSHRIMLELRSKGIQQDLIDEVLAGNDAEREDEQCLAAAEKKVSQYRRLDPVVAKRRLTAFLQRRGFHYDVIKQVVEQLDI